MSTLARAIRRQWWRRILCLLVIVGVVALIVFLTGPKVGAIVEALTPPRLPAPIAVTRQIWRGDQSWSNDQADHFHFASQGTRTLPIPLSWFLALEEPLNSPLAIPFSKRGRFADNQYLLRFGFIGADIGKLNPYGLPIGFSITPYQTIDGLTQKDTAIGLTCAACHTGQLVYQGNRYVVDGGPAQIDLGQLTVALGAALGQTAVSEKLPIFDGRFERFAKAVLGNEYSDLTRNKLASDLDSVLQQLARIPNGIDVTEGFSRLDALNRIGNQVFAIDPHRNYNYVNINAPVNFPHIWTSSWFDWVQYDGSIMQPLIRNVGEALGVNAQLDFNSPPNEGRFASSVQFNSLKQIEFLLAGTTEPLPTKAFGGLNAPGWPESFPPIDNAKAAEGARLYDKHCSGCHLPALTPDIAHGKMPDAEFWHKFAPISWTENGQQKQTTESVLHLKIIKHAEIGTDPSQGMILANRQVNIAGNDLARAGQFSPGLGINIDVCVPGNNGLQTVRIADHAFQAYALALGAAVQMSINEWFRQTGLNAAERLAIEGDRPDCLLAGAGYKARPLNGVWATAPFLHNGSVPTLYDLLGPVGERPKTFLLGDPSFDPVRVGIVTHPVAPKGSDYDDNGFFILDTSKAGNHNSGHEFSDQKHEGVIGPALSPDERNAIIEFLKSI
jgi:hypothetical protein